MFLPSGVCGRRCNASIPVYWKYRFRSIGQLRAFAGNDGESTICHAEWYTKRCSVLCDGPITYCEIWNERHGSSSDYQHHTAKFAFCTFCKTPRRDMVVANVFACDSKPGDSANPQEPRTATTVGTHSCISHNCCPARWVVPDPNNIGSELEMRSDVNIVQ